MISKAPSHLQKCGGLVVVVLGLAFLFLLSCSRPPSSTPPPPTASPTAAPHRPGATVPTSTPNPGLAPEGIYFVAKYFSVSNDSGVHGFPPGMAVQLVRKEGKMLVVSDGRLKVRASEANFTRDLAVRQTLLAQASLDRPSRFVATRSVPSPPPSVPSQPKPAPTPNFQALRERKAARAAGLATSSKVKTASDIQRDIASLDRRIAAARAEIDARNGRQAASPRRYTYDAYGNRVIYQGTHVISYSADATGIEQLQLDREELRSRLTEISP